MEKLGLKAQTIGAGYISGPKVRILNEKEKQQCAKILQRIAREAKK